MANGMTIENMPSIYEMEILVPVENGTEIIPSSEIYVDGTTEKDLVDSNSFSTQISSFYNKIEFEKRKEMKNSYVSDLSRRSKSNIKVIENENIVPPNNLQNLNIQYFSSKIKFAYPNLTKNSDYYEPTTISVSSNVRFVYPSVK